MTSASAKIPVEIVHPISAEERHIELEVLAAINRHFVGFAGSMREAYDAMTAETPIAEDMTLEAIDLDTVKGWWVRPAKAPVDRVVLFVHGGAYMLGSATAYRGLASQIAARTGIATLVLDYPLAPEHPFPAAFDAVIAAQHWLVEQGFRHIALVGDSAGGALVLGSLSRAEVVPVIASVVVFSPWLDLAFSGASYNDPDTHDPIFQPPLLKGAAATYLGSADPRDGRASPLYAVPEVLPPVAIQVGTDELLLDDARRYALAAAEKGGEVCLDIFEGMHHVFQRSQELASARAALDNAAAFIVRNWPTRS